MRNKDQSIKGVEFGRLRPSVFFGSIALLAVIQPVSRKGHVILGIVLCSKDDNGQSLYLAFGPDWKPIFPETNDFDALKESLDAHGRAFVQTLPTNAIERAAELERLHEHASKFIAEAIRDDTPEERRELDRVRASKTSNKNRER